MKGIIINRNNRSVTEIGSQDTTVTPLERSNCEFLASILINELRKDIKNNNFPIVNRKK